MDNIQPERQTNWSALCIVFGLVAALAGIVWTLGREAGTSATVPIVIGVGGAFLILIGVILRGQQS